MASLSRNAQKVHKEILIVEDDRDFVDDLLAVWRPSLPVTCASSGREAVEYLQSTRPSIVLLDLSLPRFLADHEDLEGLSILSFIRTHVGSDLPVIIITRENTTAARSQARSLGAQGFFAKPLEISEFEEAVGQIMRGDLGAAS